MARIWVIQLALNFIWSPIFFTLHLVDLALATILVLLVTVLSFVFLQWQKTRTAAVAFVPYAAWVGFAALLNGWIFVFN